MTTTMAGRSALFAIAAAIVVGMSGCATKTRTEALAGGTIGGVAGAMLGNPKTAAGATTGAAIGNRPDK